MRNVGKYDRLLRFVLGVVAIIAAFFVGSLVSTLAGIIVGVMGAVLMGTAVFGFCPLYVLIKCNTCKK